MVTITEKARQKFKQAIDQRKISGDAMLRVNFGGIGWGGPNLYLTLDESKHDNDQVIESDGLKLVFDPELEPFLRNSTVDYSWLLKYFVRSPRTSSC